MSVTITRTAWTDDDGSGTTGTVINNAAKTSLYDQIDAALASLLPLAGGTLVGDLLFTDATYDIGKSGATRPRDGFFSRNVSVGGTLTVTGVASFPATTIGLRGVTYTLPAADGSSGQVLSTNGSATLSWASGGIPNPIAVDLLFTDATYDIGKSGATRPRDGFFSRNLTAGGYLDLSAAGAGQIKFPGTQNASGGANILDDYEIGTWTPVLGGSGGTSGQTYATQSGKYVKIGQAVIVTFIINLSAKGTITSAVQIQGLPFTSLDYGGGAIGRFSSLTTNWIAIGVQVESGATNATLYGTQSAVASAITLATADIANATLMVGGFLYRANA